MSDLEAMADRVEMLATAPARAQRGSARRTTVGTRTPWNRDAGQEARSRCCSTR
jgi:hypothetical protein